jgi:hypothetical protein
MADEDNYCQLWGISATIGNLEQAQDVLLSPINSFLQKTGNHQ